MEKQIQYLEEVTIRFAGDSGDGMQLSGTQFSNTSGSIGNEVNTFPDYPSEIRAPEGTLYGVSAYQIQFSSKNIHTFGDQIDVLVAMNASSLKVNLSKVRKGGIIIANIAGFNAKNLKLAQYEVSPLNDGSLDDYQLFAIDMSDIVKEALADMQLSPKDVERTKNMFALGLSYWLYNRPLEPTIKWLSEKFGKKIKVLQANLKALHTGWEYGAQREEFAVQYEIRKAVLEPGIYRNITGNEACAIGLVVSSKLSNLPLFLGSYPITPATEILHFISGYKKFGVKHLQAEDEIAGISSSIGASFAGYLAATTTSGPGLSLKVEAIGLAVILELPLVIINVQRGGPSTGLPTKPEQSDLLMAMYGRHGEAPVPIIAAKTAADCFHQTIEATRLALKYMTPVILLTDGYLAQGTSPFKVPNLDDFPKMEVKFATDPETFQPYKRDPETMARMWAIPGTPGCEHRIGGLEKEDITGLVSQDPYNHEKMVAFRAAKVAGIEKDIPLAEIDGSENGDILVVGWGGTYGAIKDAVDKLILDGKKVSYVHLTHINPLPPNLGSILEKFETVLIPELNSGHLKNMLQTKFLRPLLGMNKIQGLPLKADEVYDKINEILKEKGGK